jgi:hypothetical protein
MLGIGTSLKKDARGREIQTCRLSIPARVLARYVSLSDLLAALGWWLVKRMLMLFRQRFSHTEPPPPPRHRSLSYTKSFDEVFPDLNKGGQHRFSYESGGEGAHLSWRRRKSAARSRNLSYASSIDQLISETPATVSDGYERGTSRWHGSALPPRTSSLSQRRGRRVVSTDEPPPLPAMPDSAAHFQQYEPPAPSRPARNPRPVPIVVPPTSSIPAIEPQIQSARLPPTPSLMEAESEEPAFRKKHRRHMTISESKKAARNTILMSHPGGFLGEHELPPIPGLSPSTSIATPLPTPMPSTPSSLTLPNEDRIRRELEMMTLRDGADPLLSHRYGGSVDADIVHMLSGQIRNDNYDSLPLQHKISDPKTRREYTGPEASVKGHSRRHKSIVDYFHHRQSDLDKLLDLYLDDDRSVEKPGRTEKREKSPEAAHQGKRASHEKSSHKRRPSLARRVTMSLRGSRDKHEIAPPLPVKTTSDHSTPVSSMDWT